MEPFRLCLALGPVAVYLLLLGVLNLSRRPFLVSGARDTAALGLAVSGFVIVGPIELFFPEAAAVHFGPFVWLLLLVFYSLCVVLVVLTLRPRLVLYNISVDQLRPVLADLVDQLDPDARWAGDSLVMPTLSVQLYVDPSLLTRNVSLVSAGIKQNHLGWRQLELALAKKLDQHEFGRSLIGLVLLVMGLCVVAGLGTIIVQAPRDIATALFDMLRLAQ
ncbi:MAG: hypothetical protein V3V75_10575 [Thermoguttaceae bacterium]|jgi:hypothetical protein